MDHQAREGDAACEGQREQALRVLEAVVLVSEAGAAKLCPYGPAGLGVRPQTTTKPAWRLIVKISLHPLHRGHRRRRKSFSISRAALCPGAPVTPPPGWVEAPHM